LIKEKGPAKSSPYLAIGRSMVPHIGTVWYSFSSPREYDRGSKRAAEEGCVIRTKVLIAFGDWPRMPRRTVAGHTERGEGAKV